MQKINKKSWLKTYEVKPMITIEYKINNVLPFHDDIIQFMHSSLNKINFNADTFCLFLDPPWGGPEYKKTEMIELYLSNINLKDIILMIPKDKLIVLKLPYNYNIDFFKENIIKKIILNNIIILFIRYQIL